MPQAPLSAKQVEALTAHGTHRVDRGLYLQVKPNGARSWLLRYQLAGRARSMGLGPARLVKLGDARARAMQAQVMLLDGKDPIEARTAARKRTNAPGVKTFAEVAEAYIADHKAGWKNAKHLEQWENTLASYANPVIGHLPPANVSFEDVIRILRPLWTTRSETAGRLRGRVERILAAGGVPDAENPAARARVERTLPRLVKVRKVAHHAAVPIDEVPSLFGEIGQREGASSAALRFVLLTACRSGEVRLARWSEFDLKGKLWVIPGERMKGGREHRVPLTDAAISLLGQPRVPDALVFAGQRTGKPLSDMALLQVMRKLRGHGSSVHGLRSSFRDWAAERTSYPREVAEAALAHVLGDKTEAAYLRSDFFDKRRSLMGEWAIFVTGAGE